MLAWLVGSAVQSRPTRSAAAAEPEPHEQSRTREARSGLAKWLASPARPGDAERYVMDRASDYSSAWTDYRRRRRWFFAVFLGGFAVVFVGLFAKLVSGSAIALLGPAWMVGFLITLLRLYTFQCPRCRHWFFLTSWFGNPDARKCLHCGLPKWSEHDPDE